MSPTQTLIDPAIETPEELPPPSLLEQLRTRHAQLLAEREQYLADVQRAQEFLASAERRDFGYAAVLGELETWIAQLAEPSTEA